MGRKAEAFDGEADKYLIFAFLKENATSMANQGGIILYQPDNEVKLEVRLEEETVWLTQAQIVKLFHSSKANISNTLKTYTNRRYWTKAQLCRISEQFGKKGNGKS